MAEHQFHFERLDVYRVALDFAADCDALASRITRYDEPRGHLADQLRRASSSIVLNIAEGAGEWKSLEKARFYRIALRSGTECAGILALLERLSGGELRDERTLLHRVVSMLSKLAQAPGGQQARRERER